MHRDRCSQLQKIVFYQAYMVEACLFQAQCLTASARTGTATREITLGIYGHVVGNQQRDAVENRSARIAKYAVN
jgi:hypothetical protein